MKYANKLMVVPYVPRIENPAEKQIFTLDQEMESILNDKTKTIDDKIKLYNQTLSKYNKTLENYNITNATQGQDYVETMASQVADQTYAKFKPDIDALKNRPPEKVTEKIPAQGKDYVESMASQVADRTYAKFKQDIDELKNRPPEKITEKIRATGQDWRGLMKKRRLKQDVGDDDELYRTINEDLYKTAMDETKFQMYDEEEKEEISTNLNDAQISDTPYNKKTVTIAPANTPDKLFVIRLGDNGKEYIVPPTITFDAFKRMQEAVPNGVNLVEAKKYMNKEGKFELFQSMKSQKANRASRERNDFFINLNKEYKLQDGQGLNKKKTWTFKKFF